MKQPSLHRLGIRIALAFAAAIVFASCSELEKPKTEPFYSQTAPPQKREFRWSNGKAPKSFDPAFASAPPESDIVRAIFDGLTDLDPKSLRPVPALAQKWEVSDDGLTWTFHLRKDARWSNGERVTAKDFVRSWKRVAELGTKVVDRRLFENIVGMRSDPQIPTPVANADPVTVEPAASPEKTAAPAPVSTVAPGSDPATLPVRPTPPADPEKLTATGVVAVDPHTLRVKLVQPDADFPALVAHPLFKPVWGDGKDFENGKLFAGVVTSGAFRIASVGLDGVTLDRSDSYWDRERVGLDRVRFVPYDSAEKALEAYRLGEIDAVTNAHFEPLALKLLKPFEDFRQTTHAALNFYEVNLKKAPFSDRRVREALAGAIERERLTDDELDGATRPAMSFLPFGDGERQTISEDKEKSRQLLAEAGFPNGENFPTIKLVINRNDVQQRVARLVAKMWEEDLKVRTVIVPVEAAEIEKIRASGEFDLIRRGVVLPAADEKSALLSIFAPPSVAPTPADPSVSPVPAPSVTPEPSSSDVDSVTAPSSSEQLPAGFDHSEAIADIPAIPIYFPTSYSLVKPYIVGFELNVLDAPSLKDVRVDTGWQPSKSKNPS